MKKACITFFVFIIALPMILGILADYGNVETDVALGGFYDPVDKPDFTFRAFFDGSFQPRYTEWFANSFRPRGIIVRTYNTIRYHLFRDASPNILGSANQLYEPHYVYCELCLDDSTNYSLPAAQTQISDFVKVLGQVSEKLDQCGKKLLIYITPSKAHYVTEHLPRAYTSFAPENSIRGVDYMLPLLQEAEIPYVYADEYADQLESPAFYPTGTHWSRPFEQLCHNELMKAAAKATGKEYRPLILEDLENLPELRSRDMDLYEIASIWTKPHLDVSHAYGVTYSRQENYEPARILIQGGSFVETLMTDFSEFYPDNTINYINYNYYYVMDGVLTPLHEDWSQLPLRELLDQTDCVVIEINEAKTREEACGFAHYLNSFLDSYEPQMAAASFPQQVERNANGQLPFSDIKGIWEDGWGKGRISVTLQDKAITENGLAIDLWLSDSLLEANEEVLLSIYVNGRKVFEDAYDRAWGGCIEISAEDLPVHPQQLPDTYSVWIGVSGTFIPMELGINEDGRQLGLWLNYVGRAG